MVKVLALKALRLVLGSPVHTKNTRQTKSITTGSGDGHRYVPEFTSHLF